MKDLRCLIRNAQSAQEVVLPGEYVQNVILRSAEHEAGHLIAAYHLGATEFRISLVFLVALQSVALKATYTGSNPDIHAQCVILAAGPAAEVLLHGAFDETGATFDLQQIEELSGVASLAPYLDEAKDILIEYSAETHCIADALASALAVDRTYTLEKLANGQMGIVLLGESRLADCLSPCGVREMR